MEFSTLILFMVIGVVNLIVEVFTLIKRRNLIEKIENKGNNKIYICKYENTGTGIFILIIIMINMILIFNFDKSGINLLSREWIISIGIVLIIVALLLIRTIMRGIIYDEGILTGRNKFISWIELNKVVCKLNILDTFYKVELTNKEDRIFVIQVNKKDIEKVVNIIEEKSEANISYSKIETQ